MSGAGGWTHPALVGAGGEKSIVLLPLGSIEAHGPHLPPETDTIIAEHLARAVAGRIEADFGVPSPIAPTFTETASSYAAGFSGTVSVESEDEWDLILEAVRNLWKAGARRICIINLHFDPAHVRVLQDLSKAFEGEGHLPFPDVWCQSNGAPMQLTSQLAGPDGTVYKYGACEGCGYTPIYRPPYRERDEVAGLYWRDGRYETIESDSSERMSLANAFKDSLKPREELIEEIDNSPRPWIVAPDFTRRRHAQRIGGEFATGSCHAGQFESSLMLAAAPDQVKDGYRTLPPLFVDLPAAIRAGKKGFKEIGMEQAYCGEPAAATREEGQSLFKTLAEIAFEECASAWRS
ncbi:MAG TPA: creatininase family protein [Thermoplasmata archaeon]|nr:creatininase family protein [Thermoplasmata archaeon]